MYLPSYLTEGFSELSYWQLGIVGPGNGLVSYIQQATVCTNDD